MWRSRLLLCQRHSTDIRKHKSLSILNRLTGKDKTPLFLVYSPFSKTAAAAEPPCPHPATTLELDSGFVNSESLPLPPLSSSSAPSSTSAPSSSLLPSSLDLRLLSVVENVIFQLGNTWAGGSNKLTPLQPPHLPETFLFPNAHHALAESLCQALLRSHPHAPGNLLQESAIDGSQIVSNRKPEKYPGDPPGLLPAPSPHPRASPLASAPGGPCLRFQSLTDDELCLLARRRTIRARHSLFYKKLEKQREREMEAHRHAAESYRLVMQELNSNKLGPSMPVGRAMMLAWFAPLRDAIAETQSEIECGQWRGPMFRKYAYHLTAVDADVLAVLVAHRVVEMLLEEHGKYGMPEDDKQKPFFVRSQGGHLSFVKVVSAATSVGRAVEMEVKVSNALKKISDNVKAEKAKRDAFKKLQKGGESGSMEDAKPKRSKIVVPGMLKGRLPSKEEAMMMFGRDRVRAGMKAQEEESWDLETVVQVGSMLIDILLKEAKIPSNFLAVGRPSLPDVSQEEEKKRITKVSGKKLGKALDATEEERRKWKPALVHDYVFLHELRDNGTINTRKKRRYGAICCTEEVKAMIDKAASGFVPVMPYMPMLVKPKKWKSYNVGGHLTLPSSIMRTHGVREQKKALRNAGESLNQIFKVLDTLGSTPWRINKFVGNVVEKLWEEGGGVAGLVSRQNVEVVGMTRAESQKLKEEDYAEWQRQSRNRRKAEKINAERHSLRADMELKLAVMREYRDETQFYYPHNLDFRGRAYPMHAHLNHLGADASRGVLEFGTGKALGDRGLFWLKVQLANLVGGGVDKLAFEERAAFVDRHLDEVRDSVKRPLCGSRWWTHAEDPFQCLATCHEIIGALESGDPRSYVSHLPVHQDGSCNGLQHYAALGRDKDGAQQVNMTPGSRPADVYTGISEKVKEAVAMDAVSDDPEKAFLAQQLLGHVDRKLVKQTVMTSVYGVTFVGARGQIHNRIKEKGFIADEDLAYRVSVYAAKTTLAALTEMFSSARSIMEWMAECARLIACENKSVQWVTPMGLPVVQPYRKAGIKQVRTTLQSIVLSDPNHAKVVVSRQKSAFPPNFVHSLDSSHMMKTAVACKKRGLMFAGVHDSFWTHAADVDEMSNILREEFLALHSQPLLEELLQSFKDKHPTLLFPDVPQRGILELALVLDAPYFFS